MLLCFRLNPLTTSNTPLFSSNSPNVSLNFPQRIPSLPRIRPLIAPPCQRNLLPTNLTLTIELDPLPSPTTSNLPREARPFLPHGCARIFDTPLFFHSPDGSLHCLKSARYHSTLLTEPGPPSEVDLPQFTRPPSPPDDDIDPPPPMSTPAPPQTNFL